MKKLVIAIALAALPLITLGQSAFDKFEDMDEVTVVAVNQNMFRLLSTVNPETGDPDAQEFMDLAKELTSLKVFATENKEITQQMKSDVEKYLRNSTMEELMRVKDEDAVVKFYIKKGRDKDHVSELLMFVTGIKEVEMEGRKFETVLLTLTGDIDLNKIGALTRKMNLPDELNEVEKKSKK